MVCSSHISASAQGEKSFPCPAVDSLPWETVFCVLLQHESIPTSNRSPGTAPMWITLLWAAALQVQPGAVLISHRVTSPTKKPLSPGLHGPCQEPASAEVSNDSQPPLRHLSAP